MNLLHKIKVICGHVNNNDGTHMIQAMMEACVARSKKEVEGAFLIDENGKELLGGHFGGRLKLLCQHAEYQVLFTAIEKHPQNLSGSTMYVSKLVKKDGMEVGKPMSNCKLCGDLAKKSGLARVVHMDPNSRDIISTKMREYFIQKEDN